TDESVGIFCDEHETRGIFRTYSDQPAMTLIALIGSNDCLELAIVDDSAAMMLGVQVGAPVEVRW
ncbi:MAG: SAM-dependent chlorinase/fluorinase, partial [Pirellulales bacterium]|nr:SAM-dependent chlorinase/fluorinase [Pirellulales bacterium]